MTHDYQQLALLPSTKTIDERFAELLARPGGRQLANDFIRLALYCKNRLGKRIGQRAIWEKLRWEYEVERTDPEFKLNDHFTSRMVRFAESRVPELNGYFEKRKLKSE